MSHLKMVVTKSKKQFRTMQGHSQRGFATGQPLYNPKLLSKIDKK